MYVPRQDCGNGVIFYYDHDCHTTAKFCWGIDSLGGNIIPTPQANVAAGEVETGTQVTLTCSNPEAVIYYTEDGSEPSAVSTKYSAPLPFIKIQQ